MKSDAAPKVLGIIPARAGSKRVPHKNTRLLGGKPLVAWTIEMALRASCLQRLVVSSDSASVLEIARAYDPCIALERPAHFATDTSLAIDYVKHALSELEEGGPRYGVIVIIQPTSPFTAVEDVEATTDLLLKTEADTAVSVELVDQMLHPLKLKKMQGNRVLPLFEEEGGRMAAHEIPEVFTRNGSVYATTRKVVEQGRIIGSDCRGYVMPKERSVDINTEVDWLFTEFMLSRMNEDTQTENVPYSG